jgi:hypothetical protein
MPQANTGATATVLTLEAVAAALAKLDGKTLAALTQDAHEVITNAGITPVWAPNPGPQTEAYLSEADELFYGGEAGGGKSALLAGLAATVHTQSLILRRTNAEVEGLAQEFATILGEPLKFNRNGTARLPGNRSVTLGGVQLERDKQKFKGKPRDLMGFDEVSDFTESQYTFIIAWNRSAKMGQRVRIVAAGNPPTTPEGLWVLRRWAPWLDPKHPRPAKPGELRWFTTVGGKDTEVDGPGPHEVEGQQVRAKSRTFIRAHLSDNPDLAETDYDATLAALPEAYRLAYRDGRFDLALQDSAFQTIPTEWIRAAMRRWTDAPPPGVPMCAMGVDCSGGGSDPMVIAPRFDGWYAPPVVIPGKELPAHALGSHAAGLVVANRRHSATVVVDMGGGYGGALYEHLKANAVECEAYKGAEAAVARTKDGKLKFKNKRSQAYWQFRESLDPDQESGSPIMLPDDAEIMSDLAAPTFKITPQGIELEPKIDVVKRLGRSPDKGDAIVMAWQAGLKQPNVRGGWASHSNVKRPQTILGHQAARRRR